MPVCFSLYVVLRLSHANDGSPYLVFHKNRSIEGSKACDIFKKELARVLKISKNNIELKTLGGRVESLRVCTGKKAEMIHQKVMDLIRKSDKFRD